MKNSGMKQRATPASDKKNLPHCSIARFPICSQNFHGAKLLSVSLFVLSSCRPTELRTCASPIEVEVSFRDRWRVRQSVHPFAYYWPTSLDSFCIIHTEMWLIECFSDGRFFNTFMILGCDKTNWKERLKHNKNT